MAQVQEGHELNWELVVPASGPQLDSALFSTVLLELQRRLGDLPPGVTLTLSVGACPPPTTEVAPVALTESDVKQWYSPKEVATLHGVKVATVRRWADDGHFPGVRRLPNGAIRIPKEEADAVLSAPKEPAADAVQTPPTVPHVPLAGTRRRGSSKADELPNFMSWQAKVRRPS